MTILQSTFITLIIASVGLISYACGELYGSARIMNKATAIEYLEANDRGCDEVTRLPNGGLTCTVFLSPDAEENDLKLYIIGEDAI